MKTINPVDYAGISWPEEPIYCFIPEQFNLGTSTTDPVKIRFVQTGRPEHYTPTDEPDENIVQEVYMIIL